MENNFILDNYYNIYDLLKNCSSTQIFNYIKNYNNNEELLNILFIEDVFGNNPINLLCRNNLVTYKLIKYMNENFNILNKSNSYNLYPINYAIEYLDKQNILKYMINNSNLNNIIDINKNNIYHYLVLSNKNYSLDFIRHLYFNKKLKLINDKNIFGYSPLLYSCENNKAIKITKFLLKISNTNIKTNENKNCLMIACSNNNKEIIDFLIKNKNININLKNKTNDTAISYLCGYHSNYNSSLPLVKLLISKGAEYNIVNTDNNNLLIYSTGILSNKKNYKINLDLIKYLISLGINPYNKNKNNCSFIDYLAFLNKKILKILVDNNIIEINNNNLLKYYYLFDYNLDKNKIKKINYEENNNCIICFENFEKDQELLKCCNNHFYHANCISKWFKKNNFKIECPTCKIKFKFQDKILIKK